jgi:hypothetical protein
MTSPLIVKDTHPRKDFTAITQSGLKALSLALDHQAVIDPRLPAGTVAGLEEDLEALGAAIPGAVQVRHEAKAATTAQNTMLKQGYAQVLAIRKAVRKAEAPKDVQKAYGVGQATAPNRVRDVKAALQQVIDRATIAPAEAAGFGLLAQDVDALKAVLASITDADTRQEKKRASAPRSTKQRNLTANRIVQASARIAGAGLM